jgi:hypothetical protein
MDPSDLASLNGVLLGDLENPMKMSDAGKRQCCGTVTNFYGFSSVSDFDKLVFRFRLRI